MKTKIFLFAVALISVVIFSSCETGRGRRAREARKIERVSPQKVDTLHFSPDKIGVTKVVEEFTPYPKYDGGTGIEVSFSIGVQYNEKIYEIKYLERKYFAENLSKEKAERDPTIANAIWAHDLFGSTPKEKLDIVAINGEVVEISSIATFGDDGNFNPSQLIWVK
jgi:hypothetical protein